MTNSARGLIIAAPASGSGKTTVTLGLLRHLRQQGLRVASAKVGPDYIDPQFHTAASGATCYNLDTWAMRPETVAGLVRQIAGDAEYVVVEGVMGLFDGAPDGRGSAAHLAAVTGWPVVLVVDAQGMAASVAALVHGFSSYADDVAVEGVIFNRTGSSAHGELLRQACAPLAVEVLGAIPRDRSLALPDRHLGLVQAQEHAALETFLDHAATVMAEHIDQQRLLALAQPQRMPENGSRRSAITSAPIPPPGQYIAVARDSAFAFCYPFLLEGWRAAGAEISFFSPLADQSPDPDADAIYLPGGYPELHAGRLAANQQFLRGLRVAAASGSQVYGECGGFMTLGNELVDKTGGHHRMAGLLPIATSFAKPQLHLGYRILRQTADGVFGKLGTVFRGHEFHFARLTSTGSGAALFHAHDAKGKDLGVMGGVVGTVSGSFAHLVDRVASEDTLSNEPIHGTKPLPTARQRR